LKSSIGSTADGGSNLKLPEGEKRPNVDILKGFINGNKFFAFRGL
jgi:hypothetical protein